MVIKFVTVKKQEGYIEKAGMQLTGKNELWTSWKKSKYNWLCSRLFRTSLQMRTKTLITSGHMFSASTQSYFLSAQLKIKLGRVIFGKHSSTNTPSYMATVRFPSSGQKVESAPILCLPVYLSFSLRGYGSKNERLCGLRFGETLR